MNMHTLTIAQKARKLPWSKLVTLARANTDLADIYIGTIRDQAKALSCRPYDDNDAIAIEASIVLNNLADPEYDATDPTLYDDLDALICIDDDYREPVRVRTDGDWIVAGFQWGRS